MARVTLIAVRTSKKKTCLCNQKDEEILNLKYRLSILNGKIFERTLTDVDLIEDIDSGDGVDNLGADEDQSEMFTLMSGMSQAMREKKSTLTDRIEGIESVVENLDITLNSVSSQAMSKTHEVNIPTSPSSRTVSMAECSGSVEPVLTADLPDRLDFANVRLLEPAGTQFIKRRQILIVGDCQARSAAVTI